VKRLKKEVLFDSTIQGKNIPFSTDFKLQLKEKPRL
jgi:hypothetical protein